MFLSKIKLIKSPITAFLCLTIYLSSGQEMPAVGYFRSPLSIPVVCSGSFGEIRADHFHSGLDYKTQGMEGLPVYAVAEGYVSRIKISPTGYGNAIYITHPNGYVSVYAHLKEFNNTIEYYAMQEQYKSESFAIDYYPDSSLIKVKKGEIIGFSGNSGKSFGAHLHFELREEKSEKPVNPLLYGLKLKDNISPVIKGVKIYPVGSNSSINNSQEPLSLPVYKSGTTYYVDKTKKITINGNISFGIEAYDLSDDASNKKGVYSTEVYVDSICFFSVILDKIDFSENRSINDLVDYSEEVKNNKKIMQTKKAANNTLGCYKIIKNNGIVNFDNDSMHTISFVLRDEKFNTSKLNLTIYCEKNMVNGSNKPESTCVDMINSDKKKRIEKDGIILDFPVNAVFDSVCFYYITESKLYNSISPVYSIMDESVPVLNAYIISIKPDSIAEKDINKAVVVRINKKNEKRSLGGEWSNGYVSATSLEFGRYTIMIDTVPPFISPLNIVEKKNMGQEDAIIFRISDNLSGIAKYRGSINGKWVLMEYDEKKNLLKYNFGNNKTTKGSNFLKLEVEDLKDNTTIYTVEFFR
jgi:hypothetical protein